MKPTKPWSVERDDGAVFRKSDLDRASRPMTTPSIEQVRAIHAVLDAAAPVVAKYPQVAAVHAENTFGSDWEARYELADGRSIYTERGVAALLSGDREPAGMKKNTAGCLSFNFREVSNWPVMKAEMVTMLMSSCSTSLVFWSARGNQADCWPGYSIERSLESAQHNPDSRDNVARGLFMTREMLYSAQAAGTIWRTPIEARDLPIGTLIQSTTPEGRLFSRQTLVPTRLEWQHSLQCWDAHTGRSDARGYEPISWRDLETGKEESAHCGLMVHRYSLRNEAKPDAAFIKYDAMFKIDPATWNDIVAPLGPTEELLVSSGSVRRVPQPWPILSGPAVCSACDTPCHVSNSLDLYTASDDQDYPVCDACFDLSQEDDDAIDRMILRRSELDDKEIAALTLKHDERAKEERARKVAKLGETLRQKVEPRFPSEARSERALPFSNGVRGPF